MIHFALLNSKAAEEKRHETNAPIRGTAKHPLREDANTRPVERVLGRSWDKGSWSFLSQAVAVATLKQIDLV